MRVIAVSVFSLNFAVLFVNLNLPLWGRLGYLFTVLNSVSFSFKVS